MGVRVQAVGGQGCRSWRPAGPVGRLEAWIGQGDHLTGRGGRGAERQGFGIAARVGQILQGHRPVFAHRTYGQLGAGADQVARAFVQKSDSIAPGLVQPLHLDGERCVDGIEQNREAGRVHQNTASHRSGQGAGVA